MFNILILTVGALAVVSGRLLLIIADDDARSGPLTAKLTMPDGELFDVSVEDTAAPVPEGLLFCPVLALPLPALSVDLLCVRIFSSRRHLARRLENQTYSHKLRKCFMNWFEWLHAIFANCTKKNFKNPKLKDEIKFKYLLVLLKHIRFCFNFFF